MYHTDLEIVTWRRIRGLFFQPFEAEGGGYVDVRKPFFRYPCTPRYTGPRYTVDGEGRGVGRGDTQARFFTVLQLHSCLLLLLHHS